MALRYVYKSFDSVVYLLAKTICIVSSFIPSKIYSAIFDKSSIVHFTNAEFFYNAHISKRQKYAHFYFCNRYCSFGASNMCVDKIPRRQKVIS